MNEIEIFSFVISSNTFQNFFTILFFSSEFKLWLIWGRTVFIYIACIEDRVPSSFSRIMKRLNKKKSYRSFILRAALEEQEDVNICEKQVQKED